MIRLAVFGFLLILAILLIRSYFPATFKKGKDRLSMELVQDPYCKTYISKSEAVVKALSGKTYYFCSEQCASKFEQKT